MVKKTYGLTIDDKLVEELKKICRVKNLSAWVEEQMRQTVLRQVGRAEEKIMRCKKCGAADKACVWFHRMGHCEVCGHNHMRDNQLQDMGWKEEEEKKEGV